MDIAKKPTPIPTPLYPDPDAPKVPTGLQGPNEQSIIASGMTVEEWQRKHPRQVLGPAPEEVGQVTTDPPDGSEPEPPYPGTGSSVDPEVTKIEDSPVEDLTPVSSGSLEQKPIPVPEQPEPFKALDADEEKPGEGHEPDEDSEAPWDSMSRHDDIDNYANTHGVVTPNDWSSMTIAQKRQYLTDYS